VTDPLSPQHRQVWDLIPWVVNGTASDSESVSVEQHLQGCADCREELEFQRQLQRAVAGGRAMQSDAHSAWSRLRQRLEASGAADLMTRLRPRRPRAMERPWMAWVMAAMLIQGVGLGVLGTALWSRTPAVPAAAPPASYHTLSAAAAAAAAVPQPTVRVVFAPTTTVEEMRSLLAGAGLQVVSGPSDADVWSLGPASGSTSVASDEAVRALRASANVRFAEPIGGSP
jgi:hypothetical protein